MDTGEHRRPSAIFFVVDASFLMESARPFLPLMFQPLTLFMVALRSYFFAYEALMQRHMRKENISRSEISPGFAVLYGAAAGYALWAT